MNWNVVAGTPVHREANAGTCVADVPHSGARPEHCDVGAPVTIVVSLDRFIAPGPPLKGLPDTSARGEHVPSRVRRAEHRTVGPSIGIVVAGYWNVSVSSPLECHRDPGARGAHVPDAVRRTEDREVRPESA